MADEAVTAAPEVLESGSFFDVGVVDIIIIVAVLVGLAYWYLKKNKSNDSSYDFVPLQSQGLLRSVSETGFVTKMQQAGRNVVVFYGSQTGTAEDLAGRLAKDAQRYGMKAIAIDPEECDVEELPRLSEIENNLVILCMATYGEGDPTDNAQEFYEYLQRGETELNGLNYAVFGLGNKTYEHYNEIGKYFDKRLVDLGATKVFGLGMGDDDGNLEEDFMVWREGFWPAVCEHFDIQSIGEDVSTRQYALTTHDEIDPNKLFVGEIARLKAYINQRPPFDIKNPYLSSLEVNKELHNGGDRSCRHIEFNISNARMRYDAGDHLGVYPTNDSVLIDKLVDLLNIDLGIVFTLTNVDEDSSKKHPFPCPTTYRTALSHYVDICSLPRTNVLKELAEYCSDESEKEFLLSMASANEEGRKKYTDWIVKDHRNIVDVLSDLPSCKPAMDHLMEMLPRLQPRYYSISSSPKYKTGYVSITAVVLRYETRIGREVKGVATNWLAQKIPAGEEYPTVPIYVRKSTLRLPHQTKTPVIMIGPGTGLAPFLGFIQERKRQKDEGKELGPLVLYFGCRHEAEDFIYRPELEAWRDEGVLSEMHLAFSRDGADKVYVQHLVQRDGAKLWPLLEQGGHIYVCGDARGMAPDVHKAFVNIVETFGAMESDKAVSYIKKMESQKRYQADVWS